MTEKIPGKLPVWRICIAIFVLGGMFAILLSLAPVYLDNLRLGAYMNALVRMPASATATDDTLRNDILTRARSLNLSVNPGDIEISRSGAQIQVQAKYAVVKDFRLYQVDLHFHPGVAYNRTGSETSNP